VLLPIHHLGICLYGTHVLVVASRCEVEYT